MHQFFVIQVSDDPLPYVYRQPMRINDFNGLVHIYRHGEAEEDYPTDDNVLFGFDDIKEAEQCARHLATKFIGQKYMVCTGSAFFYTDPGEVQVARFTEQGLIPE